MRSKHIGEYMNADEMGWQENVCLPGYTAVEPPPLIASAPNLQPIVIFFRYGKYLLMPQLDGFLTRKAEICAIGKKQNCISLTLTATQ